MVDRIGVVGCPGLLAVTLVLVAATSAWAEPPIPAAPQPVPAGLEEPGMPVAPPGGSGYRLLWQDDYRAIVVPAAPTYAPPYGFAADDEPLPPLDEAPPMPAEPPPAEPVPAPIEFEPPPAPRLVRRQPVEALGQPGSCDCPLYQKRDAACWSLDWCGNRYRCFELTVEGVGLLFSGPEGLMGPSGFASGAPQFDWSNIDRSLTWGVRAAGRYQFEAQSWFEVRGLYYSEITDSATQTGSVFGFGSGPLASAVITGTMSSGATLYGGEFNYVSELSGSGRWRWDVVAGARFLRFDEDARVVFAAAGAPAPVAVGAFVDSHVENTFLGGQLGMIVHYDVSPRVDTALTVKALAGNLNREAAVGDANIFVGGAHASTNSMDEVAFGFDIDLALRFRITPRIAVTFGYNLLFLDAVLRASDAMDFTKNLSGAVPARQAPEQLIVHSLFLGLNLNL